MKLVEKAKENLDLIEAYAWIALAVPTIIWWKESVLWVAIMSLYANAKTSHGAHKAEKAKREAEENGS